MSLAPFRWLKAAWDFGRQIEELINLNEATQRAIERLESRLRTTEDRLLAIETEQTQIIIEAKSAAAGAATTMAAGALFEAATRIAQLEVRVSALTDHPRLPPPTDRP